MTSTVTWSARRPVLRTARTRSTSRTPGRKTSESSSPAGIPRSTSRASPRRQRCRPTRSARTTRRSSSSSSAPMTPTHVDLALIIPDQVIQANAPISTAIEYAGDPLNAATLSPTATRVVAQPWSDFGASEDPGWPFDRVTLATFQQVGLDLGHLLHPQRQLMLADADGQADVGTRTGRPGRHLPGQRRPQRRRVPQHRHTRPRGLVQRARTSTWSAAVGQGRPR